MTFDYDADSGGSGDDFEISGAAMFSLGTTTTVDINLGGVPLGGGNATAGLVIDNGVLSQLDAAVTSNLSVGGLTLTTQNLTFDYDADSGGSGNEFEIAGAAMFSVGALANVTIDLGGVPLGGGNATAGLVIDNGVLSQLDAAVTSNLSVGELTLTTKNLTFDYEAGTGDSSGSFEIAGTATFSLGTTTSVTVDLGGETLDGKTSTAGLVIENGVLEKLDAAVTSNFDLLGVDFQTNSLGFEYQSDGNFAIYGGVSLSSSFLNFSTTLGTEHSPGLVIDGGSLQSLDISVSGGFSLFGFQVQANGLSIQYSNSELELSGGIMLDFTSVFEVSAGISQGGLFINTQTGALSIPSTGLQITASAALGPFSIQNLEISFSNGPSGVNFSASGAVDLPGGIDVDLTQLVVQNGQLDDIGISVTAPIPIGDTGFFIDSLSGSLDNLNNISQLVVSASAQISFGDPIPVPSLGPIFAGGNFYLVEATGSITVSASELDLSGSVSLLGGLLGQGSASLDLDWETGVYSVSGNGFSMYDGIFDFGGTLTITSSGDITLLAMASVNVPPQIPFIGGDSLGSVNFFLQYQVGGNSSQDVAAAWTTFSILSYSFTIGFEVDFSGNVSVINGNDVAALTATVAANSGSPYFYQDNLTIPSNSGGAVADGAQIAISSPSLDSTYLYTSVINDTEAGLIGSAGNATYSSFSLAHSDVSLSTPEL